MWFYQKSQMKNFTPLFGANELNNNFWQQILSILPCIQNFVLILSPFDQQKLASRHLITSPYIIHERHKQPIYQSMMSCNSWCHGSWYDFLGTTAKEAHSTASITNNSDILLIYQIWPNWQCWCFKRKLSPPLQNCWSKRIPFILELI